MIRSIAIRQLLHSTPPSLVSEHWARNTFARMRHEHHEHNLDLDLELEVDLKLRFCEKKNVAFIDVPLKPP